MTQFKKQAIGNKEWLALNAAKLMVQHGIKSYADTVTAEKLGSDMPNYEYFYTCNCWKTQKSPYFNVFPKLVDCLRNTSLSIDPSAIPSSVIDELGTIEIRLPESCNLPSFFISIMERPDINGKWCKWLLINRMEPSDGNMLEIYFHRHKYGEQIVVRGDELTSNEFGIQKELTKITLGIMLLASDSRYCEPILLNRDRHVAPDKRNRAIERAKQRGLIGFDLGKNIEVSPHFRRPHFAIRWTGEGRKLPKLVPVKGAVINRKLLEEIPTGYDGE